MMRVEIADHIAAAVEEQDHRAGIAAFAYVIEPHRDRASGAGAGQILDYRHLTRVGLGHLLEAKIADTLLNRIESFRLGQAVGQGQETLHVFADDLVMVGHGCGILSFYVRLAAQGRGNGLIDRLRYLLPLD